jgi:Tfp pilus assembly protein PilO
MGSLFLAIALVAIAYWFFRSPMCCSVADSIRAHSENAAIEPENVRQLTEAMDRVAAEVGALRTELDELAERVDFTERALTAMRRHDAIPGPASLA